MTINKNFQTFLNRHAFRLVFLPILRVPAEKKNDLFSPTFFRKWYLKTFQYFANWFWVSSTHPFFFRTSRFAQRIYGEMYTLFRNGGKYIIFCLHVNWPLLPRFKRNIPLNSADGIEATRAKEIMYFPPFRNKMYTDSVWKLRGVQTVPLPVPSKSDSRLFFC